MASIESTLSRLDADVLMLKEGARKREKRITELETSINYNEDDVKIFGFPPATGNESASEPEDTKEIVHNFFEQELKIENSRTKYEFQRVHRLGKPNSTSSMPVTPVY